MEVNTVKTETKKYNSKNKERCPLFAFFVAQTAKYLKKPSSSKNTDKKVIEIKRTRIFKGLTAESFVSPSQISLREMLPARTITTAPKRQMGQ